jgi:hypothetical protein
VFHDGEMEGGFAGMFELNISENYEASYTSRICLPWLTTLGRSMHMLELIRTEQNTELQMTGYGLGFEPGGQIKEKRLKRLEYRSSVYEAIRRTLSWCNGHQETKNHAFKNGLRVGRGRHLQCSPACADDPVPSSYMNTVFVTEIRSVTHNGTLLDPINGSSRT